MKVDVETILSVFAVISGFGAVLLFLNTGLFDSPVTIGLGILLFSGIVFNLTYKSEDRSIHLVGITVFSLGFIISLTYPILAILSDTLGVALVLALISIFFLLLNKSIREDNIDKKYLKIVTVAVLLVFIIFAFVDVTTAQPKITNIETLESPQATERSNEYNIAQATISSTLPKRISQDESQNYAACLPNHNITKLDEQQEIPEIDKDEKVLDVRTNYENYNGEMIFGSESKNLYIDVPPLYEKTEIQSSNVVVRDNCNPNDFSKKVIIVYEVSDNFRPPRPY